MICKPIALSALLSIALLGCTTTGNFGGLIQNPGEAGTSVNFVWTSTDGGLSGTMEARIGETRYAGRFFQITQQLREEQLQTLWQPWPRGWYDWPYWGSVHPGMAPRVRFLTMYSGKVVATLFAGEKQYMRCRFHLITPERSMRGGGQGECQLTNGRLIHASFNPA